MGTTNASNSWMKIQEGVKDVERLIGQRQYNMAMVKSRQTLEYMVKRLCEKALIVDGDLVDSIDQLYEGRWISKQTYEHYHRIRILGNKAVHEGNESAADANQAYHILSQEVYAFANEYSNRQRRRPQPSQAQGRGSRGRKRSKKSGFNPYDLLKPLAILVIIILLAALVKFLIPGKGKEKPVDTTAPTTTAVATMAPTTAAPTTAPEPTTQAPAAVYKVNADNVNVRSAPSTGANTKIGSLNKGTVVEFVKKHDDTWSVIRYNNTDAYISSRYLTKEE